MSSSPLPARVHALSVPLWAETRDAQLVQLSVQGNRMAQTELYRRHVGRVLGTAMRLLGRKSEAEDVVQDAFLHAFRELAELRDREKFSSWLLGIAVHLVHRRFRRRRLLDRLGIGGGKDDCLLSALAPGADQETISSLAQVDRALRRLPADVRLAWSLRYVEGHEVKIVAELCNCSPATAKRRIAAARTELAAFIAPEGGGQ